MLPSSETIRTYPADDMPGSISRSDFPIALARYYSRQIAKNSCKCKRAAIEVFRLQQRNHWFNYGANANLQHNFNEKIT